VNPARGPIAPHAPGPWPKRARLRVRSEFLLLQARGRRFTGPLFALLVLPRTEGPARIGLTVSRKVGNAVVRNRVRRRLREAFRRRWATLPPVDLVCIVRSAAADASWDDLVREVDRLVGALARKHA